MKMWPDQPLAVVVGAGAMGMAIARRLGQGHRLLLVDIDPQRLRDQVSLLNDEGIQADGVRCDITSPDEVGALADCVNSKTNFKVLVQVAALSPSMADWRKIMSVNLQGTVLVTDALFPMVSEGAAAVLISSMSSHLGGPDSEAGKVFEDPLGPDFLDNLEAHYGEKMTPALSYMLSKYQVNRLVEKLAVSWGERGARITSLSPGLIATPMGKLEFQNNPGKQRLLDKTPLRRQGNVQEIADAVEFLVSSKASYINGIDLRVDGGTAASLKQ